MAGFSRGVVCAAVLAATTAGAAPVLIVNEDNDHFFKYPTEQMTVEEINAYADRLCESGATHIFWCCCGQRASFDSKAWEPIWTDLGDKVRNSPARHIWAVNAKKLSDAGIDPYALWLARCRVRGVSPWISMRMNDCHHTNKTNYFRNTWFWRTNEHLRVSAAYDTNWSQNALDFAHPEVRAYAMGMVREVLSRWDLDGIELDFTRATVYFKANEAREKAPLMTEFVRETRRLANEAAAHLGHPVGVAVRVNFSPEAVFGSGLSVDVWAKEGLVDMVCPSASVPGNDFQMPFKAWRDLLAAANPNVLFYPGIDVLSMTSLSVRGGLADTATCRGWAANMYGQGAKGIYLFNAIYAERFENAKDMLSRGTVDPATLNRGKRRFIGMRRYPRVKKDPRASYAQLLLPENGPLAAERATLTVGFVGKTDTSALRLTVNGKPLETARGPLPSVLPFGLKPRRQSPYADGFACEVPVSALLSGTNTVDFAGLSGEPPCWLDLLVE